MLATAMQSPPGRVTLVEKFRQEPSGWWAVALSAVGILMMGGMYLAMASGTFTRTTVDVASLQQQISGLSSQVQRLTDAVNAGPRAADVSALGSAISSIDARVRVLETDMASMRATSAAQQATLDGIQAASKAPLHR